MSQVSARMIVRVDKVSSWEKLHSINLAPYGIEFPANEIFSSRKKQIYLGDDWACSEELLEKLVNEIVKKNKHLIVIADATDYNVDSYTFGITYFGQKVNTFQIEEPDAGYDLFSTVDISDISAWIEASGCAITPTMQKYLKEFGVKCAVRKAAAPVEFMVRFCFINDEIRNKIASISFLDTDRSMLTELEDPEKDYLQADVSDSAVSFEIPIMTEKEINQLLKEYSEMFSASYALAWKRCSDHFLFKYYKDGKENCKAIPLPKFGIDLQWLEDIAYIGDVVDMKKLLDYFE